MSQEFSEKDHPGLRYFIGDIRDVDRLKRAFEGIDIVVHAAALKQVPAAEYNPFECIKTNVMGAQNVIDAALGRRREARRRALDRQGGRADQPLRRDEALLRQALHQRQQHQGQPRPPLLGGALRQRHGQPRLGHPLLPGAAQTGVLPITHPDMTRFNISLKEGVDMVLWAIENAVGGELFVPKIPSYRVVDVAKAVGPECEHPVVGVRPGEKIHEEMITVSDSFNTVDLGRVLRHPAAVGPGLGDELHQEPRRQADGTGLFLQQRQQRPLPERGGDPRAHPRARRPGLQRLTGHGGMCPVIPYGRQSISEEDIEAVTAVLRSDFLTQGEVLPAFEKRVAAYCGAAHAVAVNSATSALHVACLALGIGPGDRVWTSPISFVASANCALYCGASVDFVDIDRATFNMSMDALERKLKVAEREGSPSGPRRPRPSLRAVLRHGEARRTGANLRLQGSRGRLARHRRAVPASPVGNCRYSDITVFSFHPVKIVTTAEGGMATTNDPELAARMQLFRSHGITRDPSLMTEESHGPWYYQQLELGYNYRLTELQAALGLSQMARLDRFVATRNRIADRYDRLLTDLPVTAQARSAGTLSSFHLYVIRLALDRMPVSHAQVFESMRSAGIGINLHYIPIYRQPYYARMGFAEGYCPEAERYYREAISIPIYPDLSEAEQDRVVACLRAALAR